MTKYVYLFTEGNGNMRELLGGKGANLAEMTNIGLPVPQGFTISTEACTKYYEDGRQINDEIMAQVMEYIVKLEEITGKKFGDLENPLLVSVRSGARASMPGMMDTILNLGLNEQVVDVIATKSNNPRWAWDCYRRQDEIGTPYCVVYDFDSETDGCVTIRERDSMKNVEYEPGNIRFPIDKLDEFFSDKFDF